MQRRSQIDCGRSKVLFVSWQEPRPPVQKKAMKVTKPVSCLDLFEKPLPVYQRELKQLATNRLSVFLHIPKTAGSSVQRDLRRNFECGYQIDWQDIDGSWRQFLTMQKRSAFHHVRGHISWQQVKQLRSAGVAYHAISLLRHPVDRVMSNYAYCISDASPLAKENRQKYPSLCDFLPDNLQPNHMTRLLVGDCGSYEQAIERLSDEYSFIGVSEFFELGQQILLPALGGQYRVLPRVNVTPVGRSFRVADSMLNQILESQAIDLKVFEFFRDQYRILKGRMNVASAA